MTGSAGLLEKVLHQVDSIIQKVSIIGADVNVEFALQLGPKRGPIALQDGVSIVVLPPIFGGLVVDHSGFLVEYRLWIAVRAGRRIDGLPDIELIA